MNGCTAYTNCLGGKFVATEGTRTTDRVCKTCQPGRFSVLSNQPACQAWKNCSAGTYTTPGSDMTDRQCNACGAGKFTNASNLEECIDWTNCLGDEVKAPTKTNDRVCAAPKLRYIEDELDGGKKNRPLLFIILIMYFMI